MRWATLVPALALALAAPSPARTVPMTRAALTLTGAAPGDLTGAAVAGAGDVDGDGRADAIVGAPLADPLGRRDAGAAYVVFGGCHRGALALAHPGRCAERIAGAVPLPAGMRHPGSNPLTSGAGSVVSGLGDVNGDGLADVAVSGRLAAARGGTQTVAFVVFGARGRTNADLADLGDRGFAIRSRTDGLEVVSASRAGDVNGDGLADIAVRTLVDGDEDAGSLTIVLGRRAGGDVTIGGAGTFAIHGLDAGMELGQDVAPAGDVNGDGIGDLLLGAPGASRPRFSDERGAVFVLYGSRHPRDVRLRPGRAFRGREIDGPRAHDGFGRAVAPLPHGFAAGAPGAPSRGLYGRGGAWIYPRYGAHPVRIEGPRSGGPAGVAIAAPGWVTGGLPGDVLVVDRGRALHAAGVRLSSPAGTLLASYTGLRNGREARVSAASAGDVAGSRRPDLILGSPGANRAFVVS